MADGADTGLWSKIKDFLPYAGAAAIGGVLGGPAGAVAGLGGAGETELKQQDIQAQRQAKVAEMMMQSQRHKDEMALRQSQQKFQEQQAGWMNEWRTAELNDRNHWAALKLKDSELAHQDHEQDLAEGRKQRGQEHAEHEQDVKIAQQNLQAFRDANLALAEKRTDATVRRTDSQIHRMDLLNNALVGDTTDFNNYVKTLSPELQKEAAVFSHTASAQTSFIKEMQRREQAEDPVRRGLLEAHAADLLGKTPEELKTEWAGYNGKKVADMTSWLEQQRVKGTTIGPDGMTKAEKAIATQESTMAKDIDSANTAYDKQYGAIRQALGVKVPDRAEWVANKLKSTSAFAATPEQQARLKRAVNMVNNHGVSLRDAVHMVYGDIPVEGKGAAPSGGRVENVSAKAGATPDIPPPPPGFTVQ